ncbi:hypothetical protein [Streptomyces sp. NPDC059949]|uniref:hypothetical protein n=1 Tax=Streptomyces sp. NPDC059949 TaxID=3347013 RepID=UPI00365C3E10
MNTRSIAGAARVICEAEGKPNAVPATIAVALDATGWLNTTETQAELVRLRLLQNAQPAALSEAQVDALADAGNRALNDHYHEELCHCSDWPKGCASSGNYFAGSWDTAAFGIGMAAVIGVWESMRAPAEADEIARLRARVAELEALEPARFQTCRTCGAGYEYGKPCGTCNFKALMATAQQDARRDASAAKLRSLLAGQRAAVEDPHDSPLHHDYRLGHDLPEIAEVSRPDCPLGGLHMPGVPCDEQCHKKAAALETLHAALRRPDQPEVPSV